MLRKITMFAFCSLLFTGLLFAQYQPVKVTVVTGEETEASSIRSNIDPHSIVFESRTIPSGIFTWTMNNMTDLTSGYDLQSNGSTQQLWYDFTNDALNAVFTTSQQDAGWSDRTCSYLHSDDGGTTWTYVGEVPPSAPNGGAVSGFPAIHGLSFGSVVISNHSGLGGAPTRSQLFINSTSGAYDFVNFDPGPVEPNVGAIWPKLGVSNNDMVILGSSVNGGTGHWVNTFDLNTGNFSGWQFNPDGDQAETYQYATSVGGKIGNAYVGPLGDAWFRESNDEGLTWSTPEKIFEPFIDEILPTGDTVYAGSMRGINVSYIGESPKVVIEVYRVGPTFATYYPAFPSDIYFWSPDVNGGDAFIIADTTNVPFYSNQGVVAVFQSINRPVIGKSDGDGALFVGFYATDQDTSSVDGTRFMSGYFMMSDDGGETWSTPEMFTPMNTTPRLDWRWVSIAPVNPIEETADGYLCNIHMVISGDPTPGSQVNGAPAGVTAKFYHFTTQVPVTILSAKDDDIQISSFELNQNYPNPFNPSTKISYTLGERSNVTLKVFDVLGREVASLVNTTQEAGKHEVNFDAQNLSSGLYIYTLSAGSFTQSKKMMLLK